MNTELGYFRRWCVVAGYALAMGWVEAAVVFYLRTMVNRIEPYQPNPLPLMGGLGRAELVREAATLLMLLAVGILAGKNCRSRLGFSAVAFGIWDISYYLFLKILCGWPHSLFDWDILFLLPLPWWGPVAAPVLISLLMIAWGTVAGLEVPNRNDRSRELVAWGLNLTGMVLSLLIFMRDTMMASHKGTDAIRQVLPQQFHWSWFCLALILMCAPLVVAVKRLLKTTQRRSPAVGLGEPAQPVSGTIPVPTLARSSRNMGAPSHLAS